MFSNFGTHYVLHNSKTNLIVFDLMGVFLEPIVRLNRGSVYFESKVCMHILSHHSIKNIPRAYEGKPTFLDKFYANVPD